MSKRTSRVNQLLRLEISQYLHKRFSDESVRITISEVDAAPDLRTARVFYSVIGSDKDIAQAKSLFGRVGKDIQREVARVVILKYFPRLEFRYDNSMERGASILEKLDALENEDSAPKT